MTISKDLFLSILAMDSYNRGYGAGISDGEHVENDVDLGLGDAIGSMIGSATVSNRVSSDANGAAQSAGFYALAYDIGADGPAGLAETTVISYRGTGLHESISDDVDAMQLMLDLITEAQRVSGTVGERSVGVASLEKELIE